VTNVANGLGATGTSSASSSSERARRQAVAPTRVDWGQEPVLRPTPFGQISVIGAGAISGSVQLRNTSSVPFTATLLDDAGVARGAEPLPTGGLLDQVAGLTDPVPVAKPFQGAFSVRLQPDVQGAYRALLKNLIEALIISLAPGGALVPTCVQSISIDVASFAYDSNFVNSPSTVAAANVIDYLKRNSQTLARCGIDAAFPTVSSMLKIFEVGGNVIGIPRQAAEIALLKETQTETGVCLTQTQFIMNCVAKIELASPITSMRANSFQAVALQFRDKNNNLTASPGKPSGLRVLYGGDVTLSLNDHLTQIASPSDLGLGVIEITDPATNSSLTISLYVNGGATIGPTIGAETQTFVRSGSCGSPPPEQYVVNQSRATLFDEIGGLSVGLIKESGGWKAASESGKTDARIGGGKLVPTAPDPDYTITLSSAGVVTSTYTLAYSYTAGIPGDVQHNISISQSIVETVDLETGAWSSKRRDNLSNSWTSPFDVGVGCQTGRSGTSTESSEYGFSGTRLISFN